jgi:hypothetical protein
VNKKDGTRYRYVHTPQRDSDNERRWSSRLITNVGEWDAIAIQVIINIYAGLHRYVNIYIAIKIKWNFAMVL